MVLQIASYWGNEKFIVKKKKSFEKVRQPGIEPGSIAWKATMLTFTPPTLVNYYQFFPIYYNVTKMTSDSVV